MTDDEKTFLLKKLSAYDDGVKQHTGFREQGIALVMTLNGVALTFLLRVEDDTLRSIGCLLVLLITVITWLLGEKNLGMVLYYQHMSAQAAFRLCPTIDAELQELEKRARSLLLTRDSPTALRGSVRMAYQVPFRWIWTCYVVLVMISGALIAIRPIL